MPTLQSDVLSLLAHVRGQAIEIAGSIARLAMCAPSELRVGIRLMTLDRAGQEVGLSRNTVRAAVREGDLEAIEVETGGAGSFLVVDADAVRRWRDQRRSRRVGRGASSQV